MKYKVDLTKKFKKQTKLYPDPLRTQKSVAMNQGQGHSYYYQNVELSCICYHNKFEQYWFMDTRMQVRVKFL